MYTCVLNTRALVIKIYTNSCTQLIEILYSTRLRRVKYKFQFVKFRKYNYIPFVDQVNN